MTGDDARRPQQLVVLFFERVDLDALLPALAARRSTSAVRRSFFAFESWFRASRYPLASMLRLRPGPEILMPKRPRERTVAAASALSAMISAPFFLFASPNISRWAAIVTSLSRIASIFLQIEVSLVCDRCASRSISASFIAISRSFSAMSNSQSSISYFSRAISSSLAASGPLVTTFVQCPVRSPLISIPQVNNDRLTSSKTEPSELALW